MEATINVSYQKELLDLASFLLGKSMDVEVWFSETNETTKYHGMVIGAELDWSNERVRIKLGPDEDGDTAWIGEDYKEASFLLAHVHLHMLKSLGTTYSCLWYGENGTELERHTFKLC